MSAIPHLPRPLKTVRSKITNGTHLFGGEVDGRSAPAKRFRDLLVEITNDLGGSDTLSEAQKQLSRRAAMLSVEAERMEAAAVAGDPFDIEAFGKLTDRLGRVLTRLGLKRLAKEITLHDYIAAHARGEVAE